MKDKFLSKAYGGVTVARRKLYGLGLPRQWKVITSTLLLLFTLAIGNVWGTDWLLSNENTNSDKNAFTVDDLTFSLDKAHGGAAWKIGDYTHVKISANKTYTMTIPETVTVSNVRVIGYTNDNSTASHFSTIGGNDVSSTNFPKKASNASAQTTQTLDVPISQKGGTIAFSTPTSGGKQLAVIIIITGTKASSDPVDPVFTYTPATYTIGDPALDLSTKVTSTNTTGAITFAVSTADAGTTGASIASDKNFTATAVGTAKITVSQAASTGYNAKTQDIDVTVVAPAPAACPAGLAISGTAAYTEGQTISLTAALSEGNGEITYNWYKGADLTTAKAAGSIGTGTSFSKASCTTGDAGNYFCVATKDACSDAESTAYAVTVEEKTCPTSGVVYTMTMKSKSLSGVTQNTEVALAGDYATEEGGVSYIGNKNSDAGKAQIKTDGGGTVYFNGNDAYVKIVLDCPLKADDKITFVPGSGTRQVCFTTTNSRTDTYQTSSNTFTVSSAFLATAADPENVTTLYVWRISSSTYLHSLTITRPYNITFESAYGVAPTSTKGFEVTLAEITGVASWEHTGWTANKDVKVGDDTKTVGTALAVDATVKVSADTKFTATWVPFSVKHTVTYYDGEAIPANKLGEEEISEGGNPTGAGLAPKKRGYTFGGWSTTKGGTAIADYAAVTVNADMNLFAVWTQVACPANGTVFAFEMDNSAKPGGDVKAPQKGTLVIDEYLTETGHGSVLIGNTTGNNNQYAKVTSTPNINLSGTTGYLNLALECALQAGDIITIAKNNTQIYISDEAGTSGPTGNKYTTASNSENVIIVGANATTAAWVGAMDLYFWYKGGGVNITGVSVVRPYTVSFNLNGQSATAIEDQKIAAGGKVTAPTAPEVTGQAFGGWFTDNACTAGNEWDFANDVVNDDVELFAKWTALPKLILNRGAATTGDNVVSYPTVGNPVAVPACPFTYSGYIFAGWVYSPAVTVEDGSFNMPNQDLTLTAQWVDATSVARIGSTYYSTFAGAIAAVADGQTIQLLQNCAFASAWTIEGKTVTLDMNGKNLTGPATGDAIDINADGKLILKDDAATVDPTINGSNEVTYAGGKLTGKWPINVNAGGEFVMNGGWIVAGEAAAWVGYTGKVTINNGVLEAMDNAVVMAPGNAGKGGYTIDINGGILLGHITTAGYASACVYHPNTGVLNISGGTLVSTDGPAVVVRCGESHITGGTIISQGDGGKVGDATAVVPAVGVVYDFKANYPGADINATITAGNITSVAAIYAGTTPSTAEIAAVNISGGTFSSPVAEALCAPSYVPETKANGKYGVIYPAQSIDFMAIIDAKGTGDEGKAELDAQLSSKHYDIDGTLNDDRLEAGGFKVKKTGLTISFSVEKKKVVEITTGHISGASIKVDDAAAVAMEGDKKHTYYSDDAQAFLITMTATGNAYNIFKSINIRDPFTVTFEAHGDADPAALQGKPSVILPSATNGTKSLTGWFTEETGGTKIGDATDEYTPTANITLHAQWEDISTDARLASITLDPSTGVLSPAFDPEVVNYTYTMPYGTAAIPQITGATAVNAGGSYSIVSQASAWDETAVIRGVAASSDTKAYNITMKLAPKDGICLIKGIVGNNTFVIDEDASLLSGTTEKRDVRSESSTYEALTGWKFQSKGAYLGITLDGDNTFQENDVVEVYVTTLAGDGTNKKVYVYTDKTTDNLSSVLLASSEADQELGKNQVVLPATTTNKLYLCRGDDKKDYVNWNPYVAYFAVYRPLPPVLKKVTVNGVEGKPNALKEIVIEVAASTTQSELEAIAYEWVSNSDAWTANPANAPVAANAWEFGVANTVTLTDKDGDVSVYTVTVNKAIPSSNVELATLTVDGNAITLVPGQAVYSYEYPYGTAVTPAPVVAATAEDANAEVGTITPAATKNGTATFTVTAEDGITYRDYTVKISVSRIPSIAIYDGSTMDAIAENGSVNGLTWSITGANTLNATSAAGTFEGKNYAKEVNLFTSATKGEGEGDTRYVTITIPEDYVAKFRLVGASNSSGSDASANRSIFISKTKTGTLDKSIAYATSMNYNTLAGMTSDYQLPGVYYLCADKSIRLYELSVQLYPIDYSRAVTEGRYGTICLPNGGIMVGATLYEVAYYGQTSKKIFFDEILNGEMVAGVPYIYLPNEGADKLAVFYTDEANESAKSANGLVGYIGASENTSDALPVPHNDGNYILNNNQYREVVSANSAYILSHRAYIHLADITPSEPALAPGRRRISMSVYSEQVATGIENTGFESEAPRKVLINGELYIIRGEKMYDAKGQLVK